MVEDPVSDKSLASARFCVPGAKSGATTRSRHPGIKSTYALGLTGFGGAGASGSECRTQDESSTILAQSAMRSNIEGGQSKRKCTSMFA